jgi:hypothetical protein
VHSYAAVEACRVVGLFATSSASSYHREGGEKKAYIPRSSASSHPREYCCQHLELEAKVLNIRRQVLAHQIVGDLRKGFHDVCRVEIASTLWRGQELSCETEEVEEGSNKVGEDKVSRREKGTRTDLRAPREEDEVCGLEQAHVDIYRWPGKRGNKLLEKAICVSMNWRVSRRRERTRSRQSRRLEHVGPCWRG